MDETKPIKHLTPEHRQKLREAKLRNPVRYWAGKTRPSLSEETKDKIRAKLKGRKLSPQHIENMVKARIKSNQEKRELLNKLKSQEQQNGQSIHTNTEAGNPEQIQQSPTEMGGNV